MRATIKPSARPRGKDRHRPDLATDYRSRDLTRPTRSPRAAGPSPPVLGKPVGSGPGKLTGHPASGRLVDTVHAARVDIRRLGSDPVVPIQKRRAPTASDTSRVE